MSQDPRLRADSPIATSTRHSVSVPSETPSSHHANRRGVKEISRTLAAHGAGAASTELALDLVLHEIVVEAREATRATAASIAWVRDGEMVCRATTGDNAPDLGTRTDITSSIASACINTHRVQISRDPEIDSWVEAYRQLGVRSMLFAPISGEGEIFGILQLFSSTPGAFGETECIAIQPFVVRCIDATLEAQEWSNDAGEEAEPDVIAHNSEPSEMIREAESEITDARTPPFSSKLRELSNSMLLAAVLAVAIILGLVVGWRRGMEKHAPSLESPPSNPIAIARSSDDVSPPLPIESSTATRSTPGSTGITLQPNGGTASAAPPGGLVVFEDGKVVFRVPAQSNLAPQSSSSLPAGGLLHRVNPEYPPQALAQHVQGAVVLDVKILSNGRVGDIVVRSGDALLTEAAVEAVRQWRFTPDSGPTVERETRVTIKFTLPAQ